MRWGPRGELACHAKAFGLYFLDSGEAWNHGIVIIYYIISENVRVKRALRGNLLCASILQKNILRPRKWMWFANSYMMNYWQRKHKIRTLS